MNVLNNKLNFSVKGLIMPLLLCFTMLMMSGCSKNDEMELDKGHADLTLSIDKSSLTLNEKQRGDDGLHFTWTSGSNGGTNAGINYTLLIDKEGNGFADPFVENVGKGAIDKKYSVLALNDLLINKFNIPEGQEALLEARVVIEVLGQPQLSDTSNVIPFKLIGYKPVSSVLYLIGDATPNGWSADNATPMVADANIAGQFSWQGKLNGGNFKMITNLGSFLPSYNKGANEQTIVYRTLDAEPDEQWNIAETGVYNVTVNLLDLTMSIQKTSLPSYDRLWIVGDATPNGWNIDAPNELTVDPSNLFVFTYNEVLKAGEFKFPTSTGNWGADFFMPLVNYQDLTSNDMQLVSGGTPDFKWKIENPGPYKIKLDLLETKIYIQPFVPYTGIWMVGDASPVGWNINAPHPMTPDPSDPYIFTYTGPMAVGEFKFPLATGDWGCDYFMPQTNGEGTEATKMKFVAKGSPDHNWKITEAGNYKIVINQFYETISIEKQ